MSTISPCLQPSFLGEGDEKCFDGASLALPGILRFPSPLSAWFCTWVWYGDSAGWVEDLLLLMDKGQGSMLILLDLSAAFDTVDHEVLLRHLRTLAGVDGVALEWFHFFPPRDPRGWHWATAHLPQGSLVWATAGFILSPLLFNVYERPLREDSLNIWAISTNKRLMFSAQSLFQWTRRAVSRFC